MAGTWCTLQLHSRIIGRGMKRARLLGGMSPNHTYAATAVTAVRHPVHGLIA